MSDYTVQEINVSTGKVIVRAATDAEIEVIEADIVQGQKDKAERAKAEADKSALLAKLGITADEAKLLLS
jgi:hypothetical protein